MFSGSLPITVIILLCAAVLGLFVGGCVSGLAWRLVNDETAPKGRFRCAACGQELGLRDRLPFSGVAAARGKCPHCGALVSVRYLVSELVCAVAFAGIMTVYGLSPETVELLAFASILLLCSLTDLECRIIPNVCIVAITVVRAAYLCWAVAAGVMGIGEVGYYLASAVGVGVALVIVVLVADVVFKQPSMGGGDLKLYVSSALYFGWEASLFIVAVSSLLGILTGFLAPRVDAPNNGQDEGVLKRSVPFGPAISIACVIAMMVCSPAVMTFFALA